MLLSGNRDRDRLGRSLPHCVERKREGAVVAREDPIRPAEAGHELQDLRASELP